MTIFKKGKLVWFFAGMFLLLALIASPFWLWQAAPSKKLDVLIVDKTVPDNTYREHKGLVWLLNQQKYKQNDNSPYHLKKDYAGFYPKGDDFDIRPFPQSINSKLIYIADSYGVYEEEFYERNEEGKRSQALYGGLHAEDVSAVRKAMIDNGSTLVAEFNTFASPTDEKAREQMTDLLNISWTGWIGRYFGDLGSDEVPVWVKENYDKQYKKTYAFSGPGIIFVGSDDKVVILDKSDTKAEGALFSFTKKGKNELGVSGQARYNYWFDIIIPDDPKEVLASYKLSLTGSGKEKLEENNIPTTFPAVIHHVNKRYETYYFCGDYADQAELPNLYQTVGFTQWKKWFSADTGSSTLPFYWKIYHPMMKSILQQTSTKEPPKKTEVKVPVEEGIKLAGNVGHDYLQIYKDGEWKDFLIKGVNMGIAKPGSFPGQTAIKKEEYLRWFGQIGKMNANAVRVYTIHPPDFYEALYEYNQTADKPLYVFHGVWKNEEVFLESEDAFSKENVDEFRDEIKKTVDLIHGKAVLPERKGHASGKYQYDVSPYILGWILGVEWDPEVVLKTNQKHKGLKDFKGKYVETKGAEPFEIWLAEMLDYTISYETEQYKWQRPMSFTNWVTTDLLQHPAEPSVKEDMVSVNPNVIHKTAQLKTGLFASYHIYPYYPDFLNLEKKYVDYTDHRGRKNNYAGYLNDLKKVHSMPLLVAEFGVPASRGLTHKNVYGMDQGEHSEQEQGDINTRLYEDIVQEKMAGGMVFSWQDEWFKRTWNTMDYDNPDRRPFWSNIQTNEQNFGLLSFDPGEDAKEMIKVDGNPSDWEYKQIKPVFSKTADEGIESLSVTSDERYLYFKIQYGSKVNLSDWEKLKTFIMIDSIQGQGQSTVPGVKNSKAKGIDFAIQLAGEKNSRVWIDSYYDTFYYHYGNMLNMIPESEYANKKDNGNYHPIRFALNKGFAYTDESGKNVEQPFESYETGKLRQGNGDPESKDYSSLADFSVNNRAKVAEIRIPWLMLNVKDPSQHEIMGDIWSKDGINARQIIDGLKLGIVQTDGSGNIKDIVPGPGNHLFSYEWPYWEEPGYHERLKKSYYYMQKLFGSIKAEGGE